MKIVALQKAQAAKEMIHLILRREAARFDRHATLETQNRREGAAIAMTLALLEALPCLAP